MGILAGTVPFFAGTKLKAMIGDDDALDTFGVRAVGGTLGALLTGFFATPAVNANLSTNLKDVVGKTLWLEQVKAIGLTLVLSIVATLVLGLVIKASLRLRPTPRGRTAGPRPQRPRRRRLHLRIQVSGVPRLKARDRLYL